MTADRSDIRARLQAALQADTPPTSDFDLNGSAPEGLGARPAGVMVGFYPDGRLVLTKRASSLRHHPGQIAFPGGKMDPTDASVTAAALREADEEIGLDPSRVEVLGTLPPHRTVTGFSMCPTLALIPDGFVPVPEPGEVDEVFTVPFDHIADPSRFWLERRMWRGEWRNYHVAPFGPYYIWGATARVLFGLAKRLAA